MENLGKNQRRALTDKELEPLLEDFHWRLKGEFPGKNALEIHKRGFREIDNQIKTKSGDYLNIEEARTIFGVQEANLH